MPRRQLYLAAPLRFVAFEVQFGFVPTLATEQGRADVYQHLRETYPIADAQVSMGIEFVVGPGGVAQQPPQQTPELVLIDRDRTRSVTVGATALSLQSVVFSGADDLEQAVAAALRAVVDSGISTVRRVGLRFVDEIRAPAITSATDWLPYLSDDLVSPLKFAGDYAVEHSQGILGLRVDDQIQVLLRYGPGTGFAVDPNGRLRLPPPEQPQFFLLDIDTFWIEPAGDALWPFDVDDVLALYRRLDEPAHVLFERAITDRARELFHTPKEP